MKSRLPVGIGEDLAGEEQGAVRGSLHLGAELQRRLVQVPLLPVLRDELADDPVELFVMPLAARRCRRYWPLASISTRVGQLWTPNRCQITCRASLMTGCLIRYSRTLRRMFSVSCSAGELGRVDADHDQLVLVLLLELGQVGQDVVAVDAAERPEVEQDDLAPQLGEADRAAVDPAQRRPLRLGPSPCRAIRASREDSIQGGLEGLRRPATEGATPERDDQESQETRDCQAGQQPVGAVGQTRMNHARAFHRWRIRSIQRDDAAGRCRVYPHTGIVNES